MTDSNAANKAALRRKLLKSRSCVPPEQRAAISAAIYNNLICSEYYKNASLLLTYVSTAQEIDTLALICRALSDGKRVACPVCTDVRGVMDFHLISSKDELTVGKFGILEPAAKCERLKDLTGALCVVPGLAFDRAGYRIGYGGGYYDRFLPVLYSQGGISIGLCAEQNLLDTLPAEKLDRQVTMVITQNGLTLCR